MNSANTMECGLVSCKNEAVPLKGIDVEVEVSDHVATVTSILQYENKEESPIEAIFVFPLPGDAAVCHFSAKIGQSEVVAEVKEKQEAREEYDDALSSGQQAFLLEESEESPDVFSMRVGSLPPGESASIRLEYVTELAVEADGGLRFCLPAVLNPRYRPQGGEGGSGGSGQPQVTSVPASLVPYSLSFSARVTSTRPVSKVESSCSLDPLQYLNTEQTQAKVSLSDGHKFDRDVELLVYYKDAHQPAAIVEAGKDSAKPGSLMGDPVVMLSLYPEFPKAVMSSLASCGEFLFLVDRSGSMDCPMNNEREGPDRISSARDTLLLLLKSLPMGCYFNIFGFGSEYDHIFPESKKYSQTTMDEALEKVKTMSADLGGTEILSPLKHIYKQPCIPNQPRQLFIFTDGEVLNTKEVLDLVRNNASSHRCFTFGIGEGASSALITGMAKQGGGHAQFITGTERMQPKVMQSLKFALQPAVVDIKVTWDLPKGVSAIPLSPPITTLFQGQRSLIYAQLTGENSEASESSVTVKYSLADQPSQNKLDFSLKPTKDTGLTVHRLIRSLELEQRDKQGQQDEAVKKRVVELSIESGVSSAITAFIAVNKAIGEAVQGPLLRRNVPVANEDLGEVGSCDQPSQKKLRFSLKPTKDTGESKKYSQTTMDEALEKVKTMSADLGGTEILSSLKHIYKQFFLFVLFMLLGCSKGELPAIRKFIWRVDMSKLLISLQMDGTQAYEIKTVQNYLNHPRDQAWLNQTLDDLEQCSTSVVSEAEHKFTDGRLEWKFGCEAGKEDAIFEAVHLNRKVVAVGQRLAKHLESLKKDSCFHINKFSHMLLATPPPCPGLLSEATVVIGDQVAVAVAVAVVVAVVVGMKAI